MREVNWNGNPTRALLAPNEEDRFTDYLLELLQAPNVLKAFLEGPADLRAEDLDTHKLSVDSQVTVPGGRMDLVIHDPHTLLIFEAKVGAWIHGNQLSTYEAFLENWLADHPLGTRNLFLIAPEAEVRKKTFKKLGAVSLLLLIVKYYHFKDSGT